MTSTDIYCEQRYTSGDGSHIALWRAKFRQPNQIWVSHLELLRMCHAADGYVVGSTPAHNAVYDTASYGGGVRLMRLDLLSLETRKLFQFDDISSPKTGTVSPSISQAKTPPAVVRVQACDRVLRYEL